MFENFSKSTDNFLIKQAKPLSLDDGCFDRHHFFVEDKFRSFLESSNKYFVLQGAMGAGKSLLIKKLAESVKKDYFTLSYECNEVSSIDDLLLFLNIQLKNNADKFGKIRINSAIADFKEKTQQFLKSIRQKVVIFIDSFDSIKSVQNKSDILLFMQHLSILENVKICFAVRNIEEKLFNMENIDKVSIPKYSLEEVDLYLRSKNKNLPPAVFENFYKVTKGECLYFSLLTKMSSIFNLSIDSLLTEYDKKGQSIEEFLIMKLLGLVPHNYTEIIWALCLIKSFVNDRMLDNLELIQQNEIRYLEKINVLYKSGEFYYLKDYIKRYIEPQINTYTKSKINKKLCAYYEGQLPLKPSQRDLPISRETLRQLVKLHGGTLNEENRKFIQTSALHNLQIQSKSQGLQPVNESEITVVEEKLSEKEQQQEAAPAKKVSSKQIENKDPSVINISYTINQNAPTTKNIELNKNEEKSVNKYVIPNDPNYVELAQKCENEFKYEEANSLYTKALESVVDEKRYFIINKMAENFYKLKNYEKAVEYFKDAANFEKSRKSFVKYAEILFKIASIYKEMYKSVLAREYYLEIRAIDAKLSPKLLAETNLFLADVTDHVSFDVLQSMYKEAFKYAKKCDDPKLLAEIHFKYALLLDDEGYVDAALKHYLSSTITCRNKSDNPYLSSAFSNIATIHMENEDYNEALEYYGKALNIDNQNDNNEGKYYIYTNLAQIYQKTAPNKVIDTYKNALFAAQILKDDFYICSALLNIGDFYYQQNKNEFALKYYLNSQKYAHRLHSRGNSEVIKSRIRDIRVKMGAENFSAFIKKMKQHAKRK